MNGHTAKSLEGKVALITGAGRGIGYGIALELGLRGASVIINYNSTATGAKKLVEYLEQHGTQAIAIKADVSKVSEVTRLFEEGIAHFGHLDIVVSNAGTEVFMAEEDVTEEDFNRIFNLNTRAQFFVAQHAHNILRRGGRIIMMSSVAATMSGIPNHALYAGSKAAVEGFTRSFATDCGKKGVTVNAIAPGGVKTDMYLENSWHYVPGGYKGMPMEQIDKGLANLCPLKRVAVPQDIAKVVTFLASSDSEWINGQVLLLSGGSIS